jgi:hypothetical protein
MSNLKVLIIGLACFAAGYVFAFVAQKYLIPPFKPGLFLRIEFDESGEVVSLYQSYICSQDALSLKEKAGPISVSWSDGSIQTIFVTLSNDNCLEDVFKTSNDAIDRFDLRKKLVSIGITTRRRLGR